MKISKIYLRVYSLLFVCFLVCGSILRPVVTYASPYDLMIGTSSNALMTLELDDTDYLMMSPRSSVGTVTDTIDASSVLVSIRMINGQGKELYGHVIAFQENSRYSYNFTCPDGYYVVRIQPTLYSKDLPSPGPYSLSFDYSSHFSYDITDVNLYTEKVIKNASLESNIIDLPYIDSSGDIYIAPKGINLTNISVAMISIAVPQSEYVNTVGGSFAINFTSIESGDYPSTAGSNTSSQDYQSDVSSSLSDLSSSVDTMTEEISGVTEAIQNLQGAMEPHYSNVLTQLHHITEQLHAFYDQVYNNIHLPELNMLTQIKEAIENIDLQIEVDISEVKTAINNMSTAVQNKLQSTTDQITGGYDNSGIVSDQTELDSALNEYQQAEDELFDDAKDHLNNFEFDTPLDQFIKPIQDISYFMTGIFNGLAGLNIPIQFSLTLTIALILIGYYRIKR